MEEKTISREKMFKGNIMEVVRDTVSLPNGETSTRELVFARDTVAVLAVTEDNKIICVKQYRKAIEKVTVEIPAGRIDEGETALEAVIRELDEETGYGDGDIEFLATYSAAPGTNSELCYFYLAKNLKQLDIKQDTDIDEFVDVVVLDFNEMEQLVHSCEVIDLKTDFALRKYYELYIR